MAATAAVDDTGLSVARQAQMRSKDAQKSWYIRKPALIHIYTDILRFPL